MLIPASYQSLRLAEPVRSIRPEKGAGISHPCWPGCIKLATCTCSAGVVYSDLPKLQRSEAQNTEKQSVLYRGLKLCHRCSFRGVRERICVVEPSDDCSRSDGSITQHGMGGQKAAEVDPESDRRRRTQKEGPILGSSRGGGGLQGGQGPGVWWSGWERRTPRLQGAPGTRSGA